MRPQFVNAKRIQMETCFVCLKKKNTVKYCLKFIKKCIITVSFILQWCKNFALFLYAYLSFVFTCLILILFSSTSIKSQRGMKDMNLCLCSLGKVPHTPNHSCSKNKTAQSKLSSIHFSLAFSRVRRTAGLFFLSTLIVIC